MKNGIFKLVLILGCLVLLPSCATFFDLGEETNSNELDRGFASNSEESDAECTGRFCDKPAAEEAPKPLSYDERRVQRAIEARDIILGMSRQQVSESWGEPTVREAAGSGMGGHEKWTYGSRFSLSGSRVVIFENGKVAGWGR